MNEYRHRLTGEVKTQNEWRYHFKNTSFPNVWTQSTLDSLELDPVFETPRPEVGSYQIVVRNGVIQDTKSNWVTEWIVRDMFADDEEGTKAEKEDAYQASLDAIAAAAVRTKRNQLLTETDYLALTDNTLDATTISYRQALRDITSHPKFPYLSEEDWPTRDIPPHLE